jgi:lysophospholipase L1-like esterase
MLLSLILLETALRLITPKSVFHPVFELIPHQKNTILVDLPGVADTVFASTNEWGLRGDPIPHNWGSLTSILAIGGSTTHCMYLSDDKTWPYQLQKYLRQDDQSVIVQNGGRDGHTSYAHLVMMEEVIPVIKPKFVIILVGTNDLNVAVRRGYQRVDNPLKKSRLIFQLYSYSRTVQLAFKWYQIAVNKVPIVDKIEYAYKVHYQPIPMDDNKPEQDFLSRAESLTDEFQDHIIEIIKIAKTSGIKLLFMTQPTLYDDTEYWKGIRAQWFFPEEHPIVFSAATEWKLLDIFNQKLINICESEDIACFDLASAIPHSSA